MKLLNLLLLTATVYAGIRRDIDGEDYILPSSSSDEEDWMLTQLDHVVEAAGLGPEQIHDHLQTLALHIDTDNADALAELCTDQVWLHPYLSAYPGHLQDAIVAGRPREVVEVLAACTRPLYPINYRLADMAMGKPVYADDSLLCKLLRETDVFRIAQGAAMCGAGNVLQITGRSWKRLEQQFTREQLPLVPVYECEPLGRLHPYTVMTAAQRLLLVLDEIREPLDHDHLDALIILSRPDGMYTSCLTPIQRLHVCGRVLPLLRGQEAKALMEGEEGKRVMGWYQEGIVRDCLEDMDGVPRWIHGRELETIRPYYYALLFFLHTLGLEYGAGLQVTEELIQQAIQFIF